MIVAKCLARAFNGIPAVRDVSFAIAPGEIVGFLGPNGAGKSTTMRLLAGYLDPDSGRATIAGHDMRTAARYGQALLGYLPEASAGFEGLTVREFLQFCAEARGLWGRSGREAIAAISDRTELTPALGKRLSELSKGWRQRAWFAQAVMHDPPALILDEPTDGLDPNQKDRIRAFVAESARDKAIIVSTHNLDEAEAICSRIILISDGAIVADAPIAELADAAGRLGDAFRRLTRPKAGGAVP